MANNWQLGLLILVFISCSKCTLLPESPECPLSGASFGGRIKFLVDGRSGSTRFSPMANRGSMIIFQTPPAHLRSRMKSGGGQIWIGSRSCQRSGSQPGQCPWKGDRPCLDKEIPCGTERLFKPTGRQSDASTCTELTGVNLGVEMRFEESTGKFRVNVTWQLPNLQGNCAVTYYKLTRHQLDFDNCSFTTEPSEVTIDLEKQFRSIKRFFPNTKYNITLLIRNEAGMTHETSQVFRTPTTVPSCVDGLTSTPTSKGVRISWNELRCGKRNGVLDRYEFIAYFNGKKMQKDYMLPSSKPTQQYYLEPSSTVKRWRFKVRACNEVGCGVYMPTEGVMT
ncbi:hypothetical protein HOLleu_29463 [Holothuria leucospilota]|uniref:Fibronectin type-III domain-containing protein n=1 Tax=Holothuria leucospilota TaxID=206669 RepID=A0A9Q1BNW9_HOLLE|nr:hypothetical protein HOLleu_29463 [Holothuria leucospilota]